MIDLYQKSLASHSISLCTLAKNIISHAQKTNSTSPSPHSLLTLLKILRISIHPLGLRNKDKSHDGTQQVASEEDPDRVRDADFLRGEVVEEDAGKDGAEFSGGGRDAVGEAADAGGEDFSRDDEGGGVGAEVEEELV